MTALGTHTTQLARHTHQRLVRQSAVPAFSVNTTSPGRVSADSSVGTQVTAEPRLARPARGGPGGPGWRRAT